MLWRNQGIWVDGDVGSNLDSATNSATGVLYCSELFPHAKQGDCSPYRACHDIIQSDNKYKRALNKSQTLCKPKFLRYGSQVKIRRVKEFLSRIWHSLCAVPPRMRRISRNLPADKKDGLGTCLHLNCAFLKRKVETAPDKDKGHFPGSVWLQCLATVCRQPLETSSNAFFWVGPDIPMYLSSVLKAAAHYH